VPNLGENLLRAGRVHPRQPPPLRGTPFFKGDLKTQPHFLIKQRDFLVPTPEHWNERTLRKKHFSSLFFCFFFVTFVFFVVKSIPFLTKLCFLEGGV